MTDEEKRQDPRAFVQAGYTAYLMGIPETENPYRTSDKKFADMWRNGWKRAQQARAGESLA
jgi:ribosome modulation factor